MKSERVLQLLGWLIMCGLSIALVILTGPHDPPSSPLQAIAQLLLGFSIFGVICSALAAFLMSDD